MSCRACCVHFPPFFFLAVCVQVFADQLVEYTGTNIIDPPLEFQIGDDVNAEYPSWSAIAEDCGNSRLWGGMHFYVSGHSFVALQIARPLASKPEEFARVAVTVLAAGVRWRRCPRERTPVRTMIARRESKASLRNGTSYGNKNGPFWSYLLGFSGQTVQSSFVGIWRVTVGE